MLDKLPNELKLEIFQYLNIKDIIKCKLLNKYIKNYIESLYNWILNIKYPKLKNVILNNNNYKNLKIIYNIMSKKINKKFININNRYLNINQQILIVPYDIICKIFNLPGIKYSNIICYLRTNFFNIDKLENINNEGEYYITIFIENNEKYNNIKPGNKINISINELILENNILSIDSFEELINKNNIQIITIFIVNNKIKNIYYSRLNNKIENMKDFFQDVISGYSNYH
jgi:hypothetical protein